MQVNISFCTPWDYLMLVYFSPSSSMDVLTRRIQVFLTLKGPLNCQEVFLGSETLQKDVIPISWVLKSNLIQNYGYSFYNSFFYTEYPIAFRSRFYTLKQEDSILFVIPFLTVHRTIQIINHHFPCASHKKVLSSDKDLCSSSHWTIGRVNGSYVWQLLMVNRTNSNTMLTALM